MNKNFKNMSIGAVASVIAGAYYLYGSRDGEAKRKQIQAWALKMKAEVLEGVEKLKEVSEPTYKEIVKRVSEKYKKIDKGELEKVVGELHSTWNKMKKEVMAEIAKRDEMIKKENAKMGNVKATNTKPVSKPVAKKVASKTVSKKAKPAVKSVEVKVDKTPEQIVPLEKGE